MLKDMKLYKCHMQIKNKRGKANLMVIKFCFINFRVANITMFGDVI